MFMSRHRVLTAVSVAVAAFALAGVAAAATVVVSPGHLDGFTVNNDTCGAATTGSVDFVTGPATPPAGSGSVKLTVGSNGDSYPTLRQGDYNGTALTSLTAFAYSTYVTHFGTGGQAPYIDLKVDTTGDGVADDTLTFEPIYQTGGYSGDVVPNQGTVTLNMWQPWDALYGGWWSDNAGTSGPPLVTLAHYAALHAGAKIVNTSTGGVRLAAGCGGAAWVDFVGYADALTIGVNGSSTTYNFEASQPAPPPPPNQGHKVTVCHNGHTISIDRHALPAHLRLHDTMGPCGTSKKHHSHSK
jgi:hypothetical protein